MKLNQHTKSSRFRVRENRKSYIFHYELEFAAQNQRYKDILKRSHFQVPVMPTSTFFMPFTDLQKSDLFIYDPIRTSKRTTFFTRQSHHDGINTMYTLLGFPVPVK